jgi:hypothetical protein
MCEGVVMMMPQNHQLLSLVLTLTTHHHVTALAPLQEPPQGVQREETREIHAAAGVQRGQ